MERYAENISNGSVGVGSNNNHSHGNQFNMQTNKKSIKWFYLLGLAENSEIIKWLANDKDDNKRIKCFAKAISELYGEIARFISIQNLMSTEKKYKRATITTPTTGDNNNRSTSSLVPPNKNTSRVCLICHDDEQYCLTSPEDQRRIYVPALSMRDDNVAGMTLTCYYLPTCSCFTRNACCNICWNRLIFNSSSPPKCPWCRSSFSKHDSVPNNYKIHLNFISDNKKL